MACATVAALPYKVLKGTQELEEPAPQVHGGAVTPAATAVAEPTSEPSAALPAVVNGLREAGRER